MGNAQNKFLEIKNLSKSFSENLVLEHVELEVSKGEVHALLGENGAGKSTLIKIILGVLERNEGEIILNGKKVNYRSSREAYQDGIVGIFQETSLVSKLTILENVFLGIELTGYFGVLDVSKMEKCFIKVCGRLGLDLHPNRLVSSLSVSEKKLVEIIKALIKNSRFIIMDEPTDSLSKKETEVFLSLFNELEAEDISVIYVTHKLDEVFRISHRISVLKDGKKIKTLKTKDTMPSEIISLMTNQSKFAERKRPQLFRSHLKPILRIKNLGFGNSKKNISFEAFPGEIVAITGLIGAGKTRIARTLFGLNRFDFGAIFFENSIFHPSSPRDAINKGIFLVPEDRNTQGLFLDFETYKNITITSLDQVKSKLGLSKVKEIGIARHRLSQIGLKLLNTKLTTRFLSGGNQQKVVLLKWIFHNPKVLILDEPTRGMDVGSRSDVLNIIRKKADEDCSVIYISSDFSEVKNIADRILVLHKGSILKELPGGSSEKEIISSILSIDCQAGIN